MNRGTANNFAFQTRSANHSTKQSRSGRDTLGWGTGEACLSIGEQRDSLVAAKKSISKRLGELKGKAAILHAQERASLVKQEKSIDGEIRELNERLHRYRSQDMGAWILHVLKRDLPKWQWEEAIRQARKLKEAMMDEMESEAAKEGEA